MQTPFLRIGTRGSKLALAQARETRTRLCAAHGVAEAEIAIEVITTTGDRIRDRPLSDVGGKGLFTKEIEEALIAGTIDLAVHSMKDMPSILPAGLGIAAFLPREDPRDAFLSGVAATVMDLQQGAMIGTSSVRRAAQLKARRPDFRIAGFRGNVDTRLKKLDAGEVDATLLAAAGLNRLGLAHRITALIALDEMLPAPAQGAIGLETRLTDNRSRELVAALDHWETSVTVGAERAFLARLDGSCRTPLAAHAAFDGTRLWLRSEALTLDGAHVFRAERSGGAGDAERMGLAAGEEIQRRGGGHLTL